MQPFQMNTRRIDYDRQFNTHSMVQEIKEFQAKLDVTDDEDEQRALEEDLTGKILWLCWCGICAEVDQLLPEIVNHCRREGYTIGLSEVGCIISGMRTESDDDRAHLERIMLDAGAGTSKHQLLLAARAEEQIKWSGTTPSRDNPTLDPQEIILSINSQTPSTSIV
ncbi:hypothetical protein EDC04DRAFT_236591 [Pisolithus marmoratus]|nr:hypothetical protein EDC04DRAFT_236591 [Pisolithus marmoratus]